jgi:hypothetical protein
MVPLTIHRVASHVKRSMEADYRVHIVYVNECQEQRPNLDGEIDIYLAEAKLPRQDWS